ncbi:BolA domain UV induced protein Uvi31 [Naganishia albida]|nr:BolA domain UV induced protein Uvi31 [Naganishia albida]
MSLLNSSSVVLRPLRSLSATAVSQKRFIQNRTVAVQLKQAIKGLGNTGEIVQVNPGRMRRLLFPAGQAVYLPWKRRSQVTKALESRDVTKPTTSATPEPPTQTPTIRLPLSYITSCLSSVPDTLTIHSRTSGTSTTLFGSVHTSDVERLLEELDVPVHELEVRWSGRDLEAGKVQSGGRVKETGDYTVDILLRGDAEGKVLDLRRIQVRGVEEDDQ